MKAHYCLDGELSDEPSWELRDAQGIYCARVCGRCEEAKKANFNPWIFDGYSQADVDEPIEGDS